MSCYNFAESFSSLLQCYIEFRWLAFALLRMRRLSLKEVTARATSPELPKHLKEDEERGKRKINEEGEGGR